MAKRRGRRPTTPGHKRKEWEKRVKRTTKKVRKGKVQLEDIREAVLREAVEDALAV